VGVEPLQRQAQPLLQHHLAVVGALGRRLARGDVGAVEDGVAQEDWLLQPGQGGFFDD
jgi:hypothetical protein